MPRVPIICYVTARHARVYAVSQPGMCEHMLRHSPARASICCVTARHARVYAVSQPGTREYMLCHSPARASICCVTARHARVYAVSQPGMCEHVMMPAPNAGPTGQGVGAQSGPARGARGDGRQLCGQRPRHDALGWVCCSSRGST